MREVERQLKENCEIAFEKVFDIIEKLQSGLVYSKIHLETTYAEWRVNRDDPYWAEKHILRAVASWEGATTGKDKTGLSTVLLAARQAVTQWVAFCNRQMKEKKNG